MGEGPGRGRRAIAFLLSLIQPGAGEFLVGSFRRGVIWAVGVAGLGFALLFALPVGLAALGLALTVGALGHVASAVDTNKKPPRLKLTSNAFVCFMLHSSLV